MQLVQQPCWTTTECWNKLSKLDLEPVVQQLMNYGWTYQQTMRGIKHYLMFLFLVSLHPDTLLVPTQEIDAIWHCHILHTRKYRQDCQIIFGRFIDHEPDSGFSSQMDGQPLDTAFAHTLALFKQYFGEEALQDNVYRSACGRPL